MKNKSNKLSKYNPVNKEFEFQKFPFYWIMRLGNLYSHQMDSALKKVEINISYWRVGMILREYGSLSISDIATHAVYKLPTITKTVYRMREQGLVIINSREDDQRVSMVTITEKGLEATEFVIINTSQVFESAFKDMTDSQLHNLNTSLKKIFLNLSGGD